MKTALIGLCLCLAGTLVAGQEETFVVTPKSMCEVNVTGKESTGEEFYNAFFGSYNIEKGGSITLRRPDLGRTCDCPTEDTCTLHDYQGQTTAEKYFQPAYFTHKEEAVFQGKKCTKYFNNTDGLTYYMDGDVLLGREWQGVTTVMKEVSVPASVFVLPEEYKGKGCEDSFFSPPNSTHFDKECPDAATSLTTHFLLLLVALATWLAH